MSKEEQLLKEKVNDIVVNAPSIKNLGSSPKIVTMYDRRNDYTLIYSYNTCVAVEIQGIIYVPKWHSTTTTRHINRVAGQSSWRTPVIKLY